MSNTLGMPALETATAIAPRSHFGNVKLRPYILWLVDDDATADRERLHKQCLALHDAPEEREWDRWAEAAFAEAMKDEPPYEWRDDEL